MKRDPQPRKGGAWGGGRRVRNLPRARVKRLMTRVTRVRGARMEVPRYAAVVASRKLSHRQIPRRVRFFSPRNAFGRIGFRDWTGRSPGKRRFSRLCRLPRLWIDSLWTIQSPEFACRTRSVSEISTVSASVATERFSLSERDRTRHIASHEEPLPAFVTFDRCRRTPHFHAYSEGRS